MERTMKELAKEAIVNVNGTRRVLRALLVTALGGRRVIYVDKDGFEVYSEPLFKSQFKNVTLEDNSNGNSHTKRKDDMTMTTFSNLQDLWKLGERRNETGLQWKAEYVGLTVEEALEIAATLPEQEM